MSERPSKITTEQLKGSMKEAIGKLTGDVRVEAEGKAQKTSPKSDEKSGTTTS